MAHSTDTNSPTTTTAPDGQCPHCGAANPYSSLVCGRCGARLPWADAMASLMAPSRAPVPTAPSTGGAKTPWRAAGVVVLVLVGGLLAKGLRTPTTAPYSPSSRPVETPRAGAAKTSPQRRTPEQFVDSLIAVIQNTSSPSELIALDGELARLELACHNRVRQEVLAALNNYDTAVAVDYVRLGAAMKMLRQAIEVKIQLPSMSQERRIMMAPVVHSSLVAAHNSVHDSTPQEATEFKRKVDENMKAATEGARQRIPARPATGEVND